MKEILGTTEGAGGAGDGLDFSQTGGGGGADDLFTYHDPATAGGAGAGGSPAVVAALSAARSFRQMDINSSARSTPNNIGTGRNVKLNYSIKQSIDRSMRWSSLRG